MTIHDQYTNLSIPYNRKWELRNPEKAKASEKIRRRRYNNSIKIKIKHLLGNQCANPNCPIPREKLDKRVLQIDHVNGGGKKETIKVAGGTNPLYYKYVLDKIKAGSKDYQLLCVYCNWVKRYDNKEDGHPD